MDQQTAKRFLLITSPRTASNLLMRILNLDEQPSIGQTEKRDYFFLPGMQLIVNNDLSAKPLKQWTQDERDDLLAAHQSGFEGLQALVKDSEAQNKNSYVKEHSGFFLDPVAVSKFLYGAESTLDEQPWSVVDQSETTASAHTETNPTVLPDEFLKQFHLTLLIRHPVFVFPSFQRVSLKIYGMKATKDQVWALGPLPYWSRRVYDWFCAQYSSDKDIWPIILDADDFIADPEVVREYAKAVDLDQSKLKLKWDAVDDEGMSKFNPAIRTMADTLFRSSKVEKGRSPHEISIEEEAKKWREEFGDDIAVNLEKRVRAAMPDYEYLWTRRFQKHAADP